MMVFDSDQMFSPHEPWQPDLDWHSRAGAALQRVIAVLPGDRASLWGNVEALWPPFFGRKIDVEKEILIPARDALREAYDTPDWRADLEKLAEEPPEADGAR